MLASDGGATSGCPDGTAAFAKTSLRASPDALECLDAAPAARAEFAQRAEGVGEFMPIPIDLPELVATVSGLLRADG